MTKTRKIKPKSETIRRRREGAGLTQTQASQLVYVSLRTWQNYEGDITPMHPGLWELFRYKTGDTPASIHEG